MSQEIIDADQALTEEDIAFANDLHLTLNEMIASLKEQELIISSNDGIEDVERLACYGSFAQVLMKFTEKLQKRVVDVIFAGGDIKVGDVLPEEGPCDSEPCEQPCPCTDKAE